MALLRLCRAALGSCRKDDDHDLLLDIETPALMTQPNHPLSAAAPTTAELQPQLCSSNTLVLFLGAQQGFYGISPVIKMGKGKEPCPEHSWTAVT